MTRQYFRTFVSGEARVSVGNGNRWGDVPFFEPVTLAKSTGNKDVDALLYSLSGIVGNLDKKLHALKNRIDDGEEEQNQLSDCETIDISGNGVKLVLNNEVKIGEVLFISLDLFGYPTPRFEVYGKVVRQTSVPAITGEMYYAGIEFINLEDSKREQLINFTFHQQRKYIRAFVNGSDKSLEKANPLMS